MRNKLILALLVAPMLLTGCVSLRIGGTAEPMKINATAGGAFVDLDGVRPWNGTLAAVHLLDGSGSPGEVVSIGVWPLVEVGVGVVGARFQILPLEFGFGTLLYNPSPQGTSSEPDVKTEKTEKTEVTVQH